MIIEIESDWRETGISCPACGMMTYTDGKTRPMCGNDKCLRELSDDEIWTALITLPQAQPETIAPNTAA